MWFTLLHQPSNIFNAGLIQFNTLDMLFLSILNLKLGNSNYSTMILYRII